MIKVILAEDDVEMLEGLTNVIDWESHGFVVVGTARNGAEALNLVKQKQPDLIITDIDMPLMGGLELIREAKKLRPNIKNVIISCLEEFEFAREAIRLQADEYLVKHTLTDDLLIQVINGIKGKINKETESIQHQLRIDKTAWNSYQLDEWENLYNNYFPALSAAVKEMDAPKLSKISHEMLTCINSKDFHPSAKRAILSKILIELALMLPDSRGISVEALQMRDDIFTFEQGIGLIAEKIAASRYNTFNKDVLKAIEYIEGNLKGDISCKIVADKINMNSSYFSRLFKKEMGMSFSSFLLQKRIDKATELLAGTSYSVDEIVPMVGIESVSYFYRIYKRMTGKTPGESRNLHKKTVVGG